ncbi:MAG: arylsulfotransferase family protein [Azospirillaceae bacterium]
MSEAFARIAQPLSRAVLVFTLGCLVTWTAVFPFDPYIRNAFIGGRAVVMTAIMAVTKPTPDVWRFIEPETFEGGVVTLTEDASDAVRLITVGESARLIDREGNELHRWAIDYADLPESEGNEKVSAGLAGSDGLYWQRATVLPDGDLIVMINHTGLSPTGVGMMRLDRESRPVWVRHDHYHHDFDVDAAGYVHVLDQRERAQAPAPFDALIGPVLDEGLQVLSPAGEPVRRVSFLDAFADSPYASLVDSHARIDWHSWGDYLHSNNVDVADAATAARFAMVEPGQVLISLRDIDTIALLDLEEETITWAMIGAWHRQHDPDFLPNGNILIFDNKGDWARGGKSRVIEVDPATGGIVWSFPDGPDGEPLWSDYRAEQEVVPGTAEAEAGAGAQTILVNAFTTGRLLEVDRAGRVLWEYRCPDRHPEKPKVACSVMSATAFARADLPFLDDGGVMTLETADAVTLRPGGGSARR